MSVQYLYPRWINCKYVFTILEFSSALPCCHWFTELNSKSESSLFTDSILQFHTLNWPLWANYCQQSWTPQNLLVDGRTCKVIKAQSQPGVSGPPGCVTVWEWTKDLEMSWRAANPHRVFQSKRRISPGGLSQLQRRLNEWKEALHSITAGEPIE